MRIRIHELTCLVEQLEAVMLLQASDDTIEPELWSSVALRLREVADRSLLLRQQCLSQAAEALESDRRTSSTLGLFE
jgi:hypothetical protein